MWVFCMRLLHFKCEWLKESYTLQYLLCYLRAIYPEIHLKDDFFKNANTGKNRILD